MDLRQLRYVFSVYRHRMAARAAAEFGVAQSTTTMSLRRLEDEIGAPLFERKVGGVHPNETLRKLRRLCEPLIHDLESARDYVSSKCKTPPSWIVFVSIDHPPGSRFDEAISGMLAKWREKHPDIFLRYLNLPADATDFTKSPRVELLWSASAKSGTDLIWNAEWSIITCGAARRLGSRIQLRQLQNLPLAIAGGLDALGESAKRALGKAGIFVESELDPDTVDAEDLDRSGINLLIPSILIHPGLSRHPCQVARLEMPDATGSLRVKISTHGRERETTKEIVELLRKGMKNPGGKKALSKRTITSDLDLRQFLYFAYLYEEQSVVRAAERAHIVQPALSMQLRKLETALGVKLFQRSPRGLKPLPAADHLYALCHSATIALEMVPRQLRAQTSPDNTELRVGLLPALDEGSLLAKAVGATIEAWQEHFPKHQIRVSEAYSEVLRRWTQEKALDLAIVLGSQPSERHLEFEQLARDPLAIITNRDSALLPDGPIDLREIAKLPLVLPSSHHGIRRLIEERFKSEGIAITPKLEFDSMAVAISLVRSGKWATILPASAVLHGITSGFLTAHPISDTPPLMRELWAVHHTSTKMTEPTRGFITLFKSNFNRMLSAQIELQPALQASAQR
ncbi:MAG: LysR family transcriptional regulator [Xanthobacteraceae bacterium]|nr:LysR family transcriptional regulator [Xanthobacteraceae bacterium]